MPQKLSYAIWFGGDGKDIEMDTATCSHCQKIIFLNPRDKNGTRQLPEGGWCFSCSKTICNNCLGKPCVPWEKKMEKMEARERLLKSVGIL